MKLRLWQNYIKRHDSSARPSDTGSVVIDVYVKSKTSLNNPIFVLDPAVDFVKYNYCYLEDFKTYYYVDDIILSNTNIVELVCRVDALATARQYIINTTAFVKYSSLNYNPHLRDDRIIACTNISTDIYRNNLGGDLIGTDVAPWWVLTCYSDTQGLESYIISDGAVNSITAQLSDSSVWNQIKEYFTNVENAIIDVKAVPFEQSAMQQQHLIGSTPVAIHIGSYDTGLSGYVVDKAGEYTISAESITVSLPDNFTVSEPYTSAKIYLPLLGSQDFALDDIVDTGKLYFRMSANILTGVVTYTLYKGNASVFNENAKIISTWSGQYTYSKPIAFQQSYNPTGVVSGILSVGGAVISNGALTIAGIAAAVASFTSYAKKNISSMGGFAGSLSWRNNQYASITVYRHSLSEDPENLRQLYGRPCGKVLNLNSLVGGFVQTSQFQLMAPFDDGITQEVNDMMDRGVFLQ